MGSIWRLFWWSVKSSFAFLAFIALLITIKLQNNALTQSKEELELTRIELEKSAIAQQEQSESLELQNEATSIQIFENTFFSLLQQHNSLLEKLKIEMEDKDGSSELMGVKSYYTISGLYNEIMGCDKNDMTLEESFINNNTGLLKRYFMMLYQILKLIDDESKIHRIKAKFYTNLIRVHIEHQVLVLLAINCVAYEFNQYKEYLENYEFFEHLHITHKTNYGEDILYIMKKFELNVFGNNIYIQNLI